jgi:hypothetical protein
MPPRVYNKKKSKVDIEFLNQTRIAKQRVNVWRSVPEGAAMAWKGVVTDSKAQMLIRVYFIDILIVLLCNMDEDC